MSEAAGNNTDLHPSVTVVKIGGAVAEDDSVIEILLGELAAADGAAVLVHGGGAAVTRLSGRLGIEATFVDGVRVTSPEEMELVDMVLAGRVNTELVRRAYRRGVSAVGLTGADGALLVGALVDPLSGSRTATVDRVNLSAIRVVLDGGLLPIVATVGLDRAGEGVNINADEAAQALAVALAADHRDVTLCFLSDIPGVLDTAGAVIRNIPTPSIEELVRDGVVRGGMTAKLRSASQGIAAGLQRIVIGGYRREGDLQRLFSGAAGTTVR
jgi:acetylglutamate kinase